MGSKSGYHGNVLYTRVCVMLLNIFHVEIKVAATLCFEVVYKVAVTFIQPCLEVGKSCSMVVETLDFVSVHKVVIRLS